MKPDRKLEESLEISRTRNKAGWRSLVIYILLLLLVLAYYWINQATTEHFAPAPAKTESAPGAARFEMQKPGDTPTQTPEQTPEKAPAQQSPTP